MNVLVAAAYFDCLPTRECGDCMCEKCIAIDGKIAHYERIRLLIADEITVDRIKDMVAEMKAQKAKLHPDGQE